MTGVRRGLPREPGGEPWPPAGSGAPALAVAEPVVAEPSVAGPVVAEPALAEPAPVAAPSSAEPSVAETVAEQRAAEPTVSGTDLRVAAADTGNSVPATGHSLRRGLPRTPGGEPWPPAVLAPLAAAPASAGGAATTPAAAAPAPEQQPTSTPTPALAPAAVAVDPQDVAALAAGAERPIVPAGTGHSVPEPGRAVVRRGLPRIAGGEPWPPASAAPAAAVTAAASTPAAAAPVPATAAAATAAAAAAATDRVRLAAERAVFDAGPRDRAAVDDDARMVRQALVASQPLWRRVLTTLLPPSLLRVTPPTQEPPQQ
ncbi:hypothetical protein [Agrococcus beijingensis]|uniref:hypothetical protein n=1 Tax=Agrococcus beijingensis TaxID=3068634 RepID=UPI0027407BC6|nr:hypothetical protein [Agrococcus sp. REN33]